jgi:hypothetical protein
LTRVSYLELGPDKMVEWWDREIIFRRISILLFKIVVIKKGLRVKTYVCMVFKGGAWKWNEILFQQGWSFIHGLCFHLHTPNNVLLISLQLPPSYPPLGSFIPRLSWRLLVPSNLCFFIFFKFYHTTQQIDVPNKTFFF